MLTIIIIGILLILITVILIDRITKTTCVECHGYIIYLMITFWTLGIIGMLIKFIQ